MTISSPIRTPGLRHLAGTDYLLLALLGAALVACGDGPQTSGVSGPATTEAATTEAESTAADTSGAAPTEGDGSSTGVDTTIADPPTETGGDGTSVENTSTGGRVTMTGADTESTGEPGTSSSTGGEETMGVDPCGPDAEGPLLNCHIGCPEALFAVPPYVEEFDDKAQYDAHWVGTWAAPTVAGGALNFGPHPMTPDWWDNYSPTSSKEKYGDALLCARLRVTPPEVAVPDEEMFEITVRLADGAAYETAAMSLVLFTSAEELAFRTRIAEAQWQEHASAPFPLDRGVENTLDVLIYAQGDKYVAELRNAAYEGEIVVLPAGAQFSPTGLVTLLGWRNSDALHLDRLVIGAPSAEVLDRLVAELP